jgi:hypothetical protein
MENFLRWLIQIFLIAGLVGQFNRLALKWLTLEDISKMNPID